MQHSFTFIYYGCVYIQKFLQKDSVALFVIIWQLVSNHKQLDLKDLSREFRLNCVISFIFYLYLMLHAYVQRFGVMENLENFCKIFAKFFASKLGLCV
jgi:hypothetical protein